MTLATTTFMAGQYFLIYHPRDKVYYMEFEPHPDAANDEVEWQETPDRDLAWRRYMRNTRRMLYGCAVRRDFYGPVDPMEARP